MSREITVREAQNIIADLYALAESIICPTWAKSIVKDMAMLLDDILAARDS